MNLAQSALLQDVARSLADAAWREGRREEYQRLRLAIDDVRAAEHKAAVLEADEDAQPVALRRRPG